MKKIQGLKVLLFMISVMLIFSAAAFGQTKKGGCSRTTDASIEAAVNNHIKRLKAKNPRTAVKIGVRVKDKTVRLTVSRSSKSIHREVLRYAKSLRCVKKVESNLPPHCTSPGCPKNTYTCGGQCIPCEDVCSP